jgi:para-nitrobenzyl esterase
MRNLVRGAVTAALLLTGAATLAGPAAVDAQTAPGTFGTHAISSTVQVTGGSIHGAARDQNGVLSFKDIPFAAPPVGKLRWQAPMPVRSWKGIRDARSYGNRCWAQPVFEGMGLHPVLKQDEDCLTLNIETSAESVNEKRPVLVWIYGGGFEFQFGEGVQPFPNGKALVKKGAVLVTFNYRLGVLGYFAHPELDKEGSLSGNFGLMDQIAALKWVKANISQFGGDPDKVTVFGESAGSHAVGLLMSSPLSKGLFQRAIGESGSFWENEHGSICTRATAFAQSAALMKKMGVKNIDELRALPPDKLMLETPWDLTTDPAVTAFAPCEGDSVLPKSPASAFMAKEQNDVPLLAGWNAFEGSLFLSRMLPHANAAEFRAAAAKQFGQARMPEFLKNYPADTDAEAKSSAAQLIGDLAIGAQTWEWLNLQKATGKSPVYGYEFTFTSPFTPIPAHTAEITYVFGSLAPQIFTPPNVTPGPEDRQLANLMTSYWVNFARNGNPNGPGLPPWPEYGGAGTSVMQFGKTTGAVTELGTSRYRFIESYRINGRLPEAWRKTE